MKINTELFGELEINKEDIINFPSGLIGLEKYQGFVLMDLPDNPFFKWLQSIEDSSLALLVANPFQFFPDYEFELTEGEKDFLALEKAQDCLTLVIISMPGKDIAKITANLLGPIVVNVKTKKAKQGKE